MEKFNKQEECYALTYSDLKVLALNICIEIGAVSPVITRTEIVKMHGRAFFDRMRESGLIKVHKGEGRSSTVEILRCDYLKYLHARGALSQSGKSLSDDNNSTERR